MKNDVFIYMRHFSNWILDFQGIFLIVNFMYGCLRGADYWLVKKFKYIKKYKLWKTTSCKQFDGIYNSTDSKRLVSVSTFFFVSTL